MWNDLLCVFVFRHAWKVILKIILIPIKYVEYLKPNKETANLRNLERAMKRSNEIEPYWRWKAWNIFVKINFRSSFIDSKFFLMHSITKRILLIRPKILKKFPYDYEQCARVLSFIWAGFVHKKWIILNHNWGLCSWWTCTFRRTLYEARLMWREGAREVKT